VLQKNMLVQELDQSVTHQRNLVNMAQKLDSEVSFLERSRRAGSVPPATASGGASVPVRSPRSGRKRRGNRRDQLHSDRAVNQQHITDRAVNLTGSVAKEVVITAPRPPHASSSLPMHTMPLMNTAGCLPPPLFSSAHPTSHTVAGIRASLVMAPTASVSGSRMPSIRFVNGDDSPARFQKRMAPAVGVSGLRMPRGRQDSSSSTDSAETVRHLEHGACVGDVDRYLAAGAVMQSSAGSASIRHTCGAFATPSAVSSAQGMRFYFRPALLSGVSFPASRSELEQYKQVVHGSANIPPTEASTVSTPEQRGPRVRQRSPGRGRGRSAAPSSGTLRTSVPMVATTSVPPRFFSVGVVPSSLSISSARGIAQQPLVTAVPGMLRHIHWLWLGSSAKFLLVA